MPVSEPQVQFIVKHSLAVPMLVNLKYLYTDSENGERRYASFNNNPNQLGKCVHLPAQIAVTDPLDKHAYDTIRLDYTSENGNIDTLFTISPKTISYAFDVETDTTSHMQQYRITDDTDIQLTTTISIPFAFNDSVAITYRDTISDINLSAMQLDSLLERTRVIKQVEDAQLQLFLIVENSIPMAIEGRFTCYDANHQIVALSSQNDSVLSFVVDCPKAIHNGITQEPSVNQIPVITITEEDWNALASVRYIVFEAMLGDNSTAATLTPEAGIRIHLSVAADIDMTIDLKELF